MDSGCTFPVTITAVTREMKVEIIPLNEELNIGSWWQEDGGSCCHRRLKLQGNPDLFGSTQEVGVDTLDVSAPDD